MPSDFSFELLGILQNGRKCYETLCEMFDAVKFKLYKRLHTEYVVSVPNVVHLVQYHKYAVVEPNFRLKYSLLNLSCNTFLPFRATINTTTYCRSVIRHRGSRHLESTRQPCQPHSYKNASAS